MDGVWIIPGQQKVNRPLHTSVEETSVTKIALGLPGEGRTDKLRLPIFQVTEIAKDRKYIIGVPAPGTLVFNDMHTEVTMIEPISSGATLRREQNWIKDRFRNLYKTRFGPSSFSTGLGIGPTYKWAGARNRFLNPFDRGGRNQF